jgi:methoxymalonate biosynthesis acyl carrier protein
MTADEILAQAREFLSRFVADEVPVDQDIFATGLVNSLFAMQLVLFLESELGVQVDNEDLDRKNFRSLAAIVGFVERKLA